MLANINKVFDTFCSYIFNGSTLMCSNLWKNHWKSSCYWKYFFKTSENITYNINDFEKNFDMNKWLDKSVNDTCIKESTDNIVIKYFEKKDFIKFETFEEKNNFIFLIERALYKYALFYSLKYKQQFFFKDNLFFLTTMSSGYTNFVQTYYARFYSRYVSEFFTNYLKTIFVFNAYNFDLYSSFKFILDIFFIIIKNFIIFYMLSVYNYLKNLIYFGVISTISLKYLTVKSAYIKYYINFFILNIIKLPFFSFVFLLYIVYKLAYMFENILLMLSVELSSKSQLTSESDELGNQIDNLVIDNLYSKKGFDIYTFEVLNLIFNLAENFDLFLEICYWFNLRSDLYTLSYYLDKFCDSRYAFFCLNINGASSDKTMAYALETDAYNFLKFSLDTLEYENLIESLRMFSSDSILNENIELENINTTKIFINQKNLVIYFFYIFESIIDLSYYIYSGLNKLNSIILNKFSLFLNKSSNTNFFEISVVTAFDLDDSLVKINKNSNTVFVEKLSKANDILFLNKNISLSHNIEAIWCFWQRRQNFFFITPSPWPFLISIVVAIFMSGFVLYFNFYTTSIYLYIGLLLVTLVFFFWCRDFVRELIYNNNYSLLLLNNFKLGFWLFILSEFMLFFSFFWGFYHSMFEVSIYLGVEWPPISGVNINSIKIPFMNTVLLVCSGLSLTAAQFALVAGEFSIYRLSFFFTVFHAVCFLISQINEYMIAFQQANDSIYGSSMYMLTAFHGMHVFIGLCFLVVCHIRTEFGHLRANDILGFILAGWYWHFVDVVWIGVFISVYVYGTWYPEQIMSTNLNLIFF